jgi:hypothetical protein
MPTTEPSTIATTSLSSISGNEIMASHLFRVSYSYYSSYEQGQAENGLSSVTSTGRSDRQRLLKFAAYCGKEK